MSDPTTETLQRVMQAIVAAAPEAPDLEMVKIPTTSRRTSPVLVMAGAFAFVLLVGAVTSLFALGNDRGAVPSRGPGNGAAVTTSVAPTPQTAMTDMESVVERLSRYSDPVTDQLSLGTFSGPEPAFDAAELGNEMPLANAYDGADTLPLVPEVFGGLSDAIVYIGSIEGVDGYVYGVDTDSGTTEVCQSESWVAAGTTMTACFDLAESGLSKSIGMADSATDGIVIAATALGDEVSVVAIELPGGQRYWQRPAAGSAMFVTDEPEVLTGVTITTYDESGNILTTDQFNPDS